MVCPYAERRGFIVYCKLLRKHVNPLTRPCISGDYTRCPDYRRAVTESERHAITVKSVEHREVEGVGVSYIDEASAKLSDPIHLAVLIARSKYIDTATGRPLDVLAWAVNVSRDKGLKLARLDLSCPEEGWSAILLLQDATYRGVVMETREGEKIIGRTAWNAIRGSECRRAVGILYEVTSYS